MVQKERSRKSEREREREMVRVLISHFFIYINIRNNIAKGNEKRWMGKGFGVWFNSSTVYLGK